MPQHHRWWTSWRRCWLYRSLLHRYKNSIQVLFSTARSSQTSLPEAHSKLQPYGKLVTTAVRLFRRSQPTLTLPPHLPSVSS